MTERRIEVLIIDDDSRVRQAIGCTVSLEPDMVVVGETADAAVARTLARDLRPAVTLVDLLLPNEVAGLALVADLTGPLGCVVVAMSVRGGLRDAALAAGAVSFVEKGGEIEALLDVLRGATGRLAG